MTAGWLCNCWSSGPSPGSHREFWLGLVSDITDSWAETVGPSSSAQTTIISLLSLLNWRKLSSAHLLSVCVGLYLQVMCYINLCVVCVTMVTHPVVFCYLSQISLSFTWTFFQVFSCKKNVLLDLSCEIVFLLIFFIFIQKTFSQDFFFFWKKCFLFPLKTLFFFFFSYSVSRLVKIYFFFSWIFFLFDPVEKIKIKVFVQFHIWETNMLKK